MSRDLVRRAVGRLRRTVVGAPAAPSTPEEPVPPVAPLPVLGYIVAGGGGAHPASAHVRVVRRAEHLAATGRAEVRQVDPEAFVAGADGTPYRAVLVQRDALPSSLVQPLLDAAAARGIRVAAEVDDDFFTDSGRARLARAEYDPDRLASIETLVRGADLVVVSTEELATVVRPRAREVVVVRNALDPAIWTTSVPSSPGPTDHEHRVLYMGTLTHGADLELLRDVFTDLRATDGVPIRLEVIGVTEEADTGWYRRLEVPDGHYPAFARWLVDHRDRWRAGVAPLRDEEFNRAKSDLKAIEYTALGLPAVVSDRPSYRAAAAHGVVTVPDDPAAWRDAVRVAVDRGTADRDAAAWVRSERMIGVTADDWADVLLG
ncbi:glycosyltransferase [Curtobacterium sp. MCBD17_032]|uniref:glycosyltransferase n=1 Tax=Curtobacterium sp. MCBD17_032 TaxID=2175659 RepID=UPI000DA82867|nr:glycosyltransferase [Curtobacterium sp. MCBD17_032]PZE84982.1 hypothetical protein DEI91_05880 [Curtobacterium sp. MCBD17_032]